MISHVPLAYFPPCHMSNLRKNHVACHCLYSPPVPCHLPLCRMSILRNGHVALSILGVEGPSHPLRACPLRGNPSLNRNDGHTSMSARFVFTPTDDQTLSPLDHILQTTSNLICSSVVVWKEAMRSKSHPV